MSTDSATEIIHWWGSTVDRELFIFQDCREKIPSYLHSVNEVHQTITSANSENERKDTESVIRIAVFRLADEFRYILKLRVKLNSSLYPISYSTTTTDNNYIIDEDDYVNRNRLSMDEINDLRIIAVTLNSSGFLHECIKVYASERKSFVTMEKLSVISCLRLEWGVLESKIKIWIKAAKICFDYYFENEKRLCEQIFHDLGDEEANSSPDYCLMETIKDHTIRLLDTVEALSCIRPEPERLFRILDLHDTLSDLLPAIDNIFHSQSSDFVRTKVVNQIIPKLANKAIKILLLFENSLVNETSPVVCSQPIHKLSTYVMRYVYKIFDHKQTLMRLSLPDVPSVDAAGSFSLHVVLIITSLVSNLEVKSRLCDDEAASRFFAMNNFHYIIQKIQARPELLEIVVDDGFNELVDKFEHARSDYLKLTFDVALRYLRDEGLNKIKISSFKVLKLAYKVKRFNSEFERLEKDLGKVVVPDFGLVLELRKLIVEMVVTAYTSFLVRVKKTPRLESYVKYSAEGIESAIQKFFDCNPDQ
ncbi:exocyst complex component EXO70B1-like [Bidens hawaiensis]|uniref:exocyst complex component EXO70B1-like n=1 Tax=Bidens hawaiensis TaxID=980011 RepID=UPI004049BA34